MALSFLLHISSNERTTREIGEICRIFQRSSRVGIFGSSLSRTFQSTPIIGF